jgi:parvulin-like peptidyl-prolyl isomerase
MFTHSLRRSQLRSRAGYAGALSIILAVMGLAACAGEHPATSSTMQIAGTQPSGAQHSAQAATQAGTATPAQATAPTSGVLATVNGVPIPASRLDEALRATHSPDTREARQTLKDELIARELVYQAGVAAGLANDAQVQRAVAQAREQAIVTTYLARKVPPAVISDAALRARYDTMFADWGPLDYQPRIISLSTSDQVKTVQQLLSQGKPFDQLAVQYSVAPNAAQGGQWPWTNLPVLPQEGHTHGMPLAVAQALVTMQPGQVRGPIAVGQNFVIVRLDNRREARKPSFDSMRAQLSQQLAGEADQRDIQALVSSLRQQARIQ